MSGVTTRPARRSRGRWGSRRTQGCASSSRRKLLREHLFHERGDTSGRVGSDLALLVADHAEEAVERLAHDVAVEIVALGLQKGDRLDLTEKLVVLPHGADLVHRLVDDGPEGHRE